MSDNKILNIIIDAALKAGKKILEIYDEPFSNDAKADGSPVTIADKQSEQIILNFLTKTNIPALAEESMEAGIIPELNERFFCVDPLDGTKEFIKKNGEFTINIALIENKKPILGIVSAPAKNVAYIGGKEGAYKFDIIDNELKNKRKITTLKGADFNLVASRSHGSELLEKLTKKLPKYNNISVGSALKFCLLAEGKASLYPRFTHTYEWDSAAGQAVLEAAGGVVLTLDGEPLSYKKSQNNYLNPYFVAANDKYLAKQTAKYMKEICRQN